LAARPWATRAKLRGADGKTTKDQDADHDVQMLLSIPPKYAVSQVVGFIKGKSAIHLARVYGERKRNFIGQHFWARGFFVNTVGRDEEAIRAYIRNQEKEDQRLEQMNLWR
jgi:putative transposase